MSTTTRTYYTSEDKTNMETPRVNAFISYSHKDREYGGQAKVVLNKVGIDAFLAHDDLDVSEQWKRRILEELGRCNLFVPLLSKNFLESKWAQQETGYIASRPEIIIAPLSIDGTTPFGFFSHIQGRRIAKDGIARELLVEPLVKHFPRTILPALIHIAGRAGSFRRAERLMRPLVPHFSRFTDNEAQALAEVSVDNGQIWNAADCRDEYLPEFIRLQGGNIERETLRALQYQLDNRTWYPRAGR